MVSVFKSGFLPILLWIPLLFAKTGFGKRTMMVEPLNPDDFEKGNSLVISPALENDVNFNDGTDDDVNPDKLSRNRVETDLNRKWSNNAIPYLIGDGFSDNERAMIARSLEVFRKLTCVKVIVRTDEPDYLVIKKSDDSSCSSSIGRQGGRQSLRLATRCISRPGSLIHEFMHTFGFWHEQSRVDRDEHIKIYYHNIQKGTEKQFDKVAGTKFANQLTKYDYLSILHYTNNANSRNGKPTMEKLKGKKGQLGQRKNLTTIDIEKIERFYKCNQNKNVQKPNTISRLYLPNLDIKCKDYDSKYCKRWAKLGYCLKSEMFMTVYCKKSCNRCGMPGCMDIRADNCKKWVKKNYCSIYKDYMDQYCSKSCRICV